MTSVSYFRSIKTKIRYDDCTGFYIGITIHQAKQHLKEHYQDVVKIGKILQTQLIKKTKRKRSSQQSQITVNRSFHRFLKYLNYAQ